MIGLETGLLPFYLPRGRLSTALPAATVDRAVDNFEKQEGNVIEWSIIRGQD
jgi:hypothetical protein